MESYNIAQLTNVVHILLLIFKKVDQNTGAKLMRTTKWVNSFISESPKNMYAKLNEERHLYVSRVPGCCFPVPIADARLFRIRTHRIEIMRASYNQTFDNDAADCLIRMVSSMKLTSVWLGFLVDDITCTAGKLPQLRNEHTLQRPRQSVSNNYLPGNSKYVCYPFYSHLTGGFRPTISRSIVEPAFLESLDVPFIYIESVDHTTTLNKMLRKWVAGQRALGYIFVGEMDCIPDALVAQLPAVLIYSEVTHHSSPFAKYRNIPGEIVANWIWTIKREHPAGNQEKVIWWNSLSKRIIVKDLTDDPLKPLKGRFNFIGKCIGDLCELAPEKCEKQCPSKLLRIAAAFGRNQ